MSIEFLKHRINIFSGIEIDPINDQQVIDVLQRKFNIFLPQRASLDDALAATVSEHEIINLIMQYRSTAKKPKKSYSDKSPTFTRKKLHQESS